MRCFTLPLVLVLTGCSPAPKDGPPAPPATARPAAILLSEPAADTMLGTLHTVGDMSRLAPIADVTVHRDLNADQAERDGAARVTPENLEQLLTAGKPVAPRDKLIDEWSYAPWYRATFVVGGRRWSVALYLGGLGIIADDASRKGAFRFDVPRTDGG